MDRRISIFGLGKLGASMAAAIASRGHHVVGVDVSPHVIDAVMRHVAPVRETDLDELLAAHGSRVTATGDAVDAVHGTDVTFVVVPTPSESDGRFSLQYAEAAMASIGRALASKNAYHLVVLTSTVLPGSTRYRLLPILESTSGKRCGSDFGLCYSPEFIALGSVIRDFLNPDFLLIGESDEAAGALLELVYGEIVVNAAPARRMTLENAEIAKIALNSYVTTKITFANMLAELCEQLPNGDVDVVTSAIGLDRRIGPAFFNGGLGFGGPCFPRDNRALASIARALGSSAELPLAADSANARVAPRVVNMVRSVLTPGQAVAVLGLAYKPRSNVMEESQGLTICDALKSVGYVVRAFDPLAMHEGLSEMTMENAVRDASVVIVATPDKVFQSSIATLRQARAGALVIDCWRLLDRSDVTQLGLRYAALGVSSANADSAEKLRRYWLGGTGALTSG